ncbi:MAG: hypothetical protein A2Z16_05930 [Chloroflexi bacterium RBG_16_54_18]|nr:MAG: hypothetical protein A2Z16_05930 [Chloroflexi bacterium RBG_16_54_18]
MNFFYINSNTTAKKIEAFREIPAGWHFGNGSPPIDATIEIALQLNTEALELGFSKTNAFLGTEGEIQVTAYLGQLYLELTIERNSIISVVIENGNTEIFYKENLSMQETIAFIRSLRGELWALSELSINITSIEKKDDSQVLPSKTQVMAAESPFLMNSAYCKLAQTSAGILKDTIIVNHVYPLFFGEFPQKTYHHIVSSHNKPLPEEIFATTTS